MTDTHRYLDDDGDEHECGDEGRLCEPCWRVKEDYWLRYFGLRPGMTPEEERSRLEAMKPFNRADYEAAWRLKRELER